jgi:hypothetical protein
MAREPDTTTIQDAQQPEMFAPPPRVAGADIHLTDPGDFTEAEDPDNPLGWAFPQGTGTPDAVIRASVALAFATRALNLSENAERALVGMAVRSLGRR